MELKRARDDVGAFIAGLPPAQRATTEALREAVRAAAPELSEKVRWGLPLFVGRANVAALLVYDEEVHLAFFEGARLDVTAGMLERAGINEVRYLMQGVGDRLRFLRHRSAAQVDRTTVAELVGQAVQVDGARPPARR